MSVNPKGHGSSGRSGNGRYPATEGAAVDARDRAPRHCPPRIEKAERRTTGRAAAVKDARHQVGGADLFQPAPIYDEGVVRYSTSSADEDTGFVDRAALARGRKSGTAGSAIFCLWHRRSRDEPSRFPTFVS